MSFRSAFCTQFLMVGIAMPTPIADLDAKGVGLGPQGQFDNAGLIRVVGVLDSVRRRLAHR